MSEKTACVYEHWRPDLNVCFYVGASRVGESRAEDFSPRNLEHKAVLEELSAAGIAPTHKLVWDGLEDDCVGTYEKIRIAYMRSMFGEYLTNIAEGGFGFSLTREKNREIQLVVQNKPEVNAKRSASLILANAKPEVIRRRSVAATDAHAKPGAAEARKVREADPLLNAKRKESARLGGLKAGQRSKEELRARGIKAAETRRIRKLEAKNG